MSDINTWSTVAASNSSAPPDGWPENTMTIGQINNAAREMMAAMARWYQDQSGVLLATGLHFSSSLNAYGYNLTINRSVSRTLDLRVRFRVPQTSVGPTWLNVNGMGPEWIMWPDGTHCRANDLADVVEVYWHSGGLWALDNLQRRQVGEFPTGGSVLMLFAMASPPAGWQQSASWNDRLIRVVSGPGTGVGGTWAIGGLSQETADHIHGFNFSVNTGTPSATVNGLGPAGGVISGGEFHTHVVTVAANTGGVSAVHTHIGDGTWRPAYADMILAIKS